jgi:hypothetical protein
MLTTNRRVEMATQEALSPQEVVARGKEIYENKLRFLVEPDHIGEFMAINIETGEWEMGKDHAETLIRARAKFPTAEIYGLRVGYVAAESMGGGLRRIIRTAA